MWPARPAHRPRLTRSPKQLCTAQRQRQRPPRWTTPRRDCAVQEQTACRDSSLRSGHIASSRCGQERPSYRRRLARSPKQLRTAQRQRPRPPRWTTPRRDSRRARTNGLSRQLPSLWSHRAFAMWPRAPGVPAPERPCTATTLPHRTPTTAALGEPHGAFRAVKKQTTRRVSFLRIPSALASPQPDRSPPPSGGSYAGPHHRGALRAVMNERTDASPYFALATWRFSRRGQSARRTGPGQTAPPSTAAPPHAHPHRSGARSAQ